MTDRYERLRAGVEGLAARMVPSAYGDRTRSGVRPVLAWSGVSPDELRALLAECAEAGEGDDVRERLGALMHGRHGYVATIKQQLACADNETCGCTFCEFVEDLDELVGDPAPDSGAAERVPVYNAEGVRIGAGVPDGRGGIIQASLSCWPEDLTAPDPGEAVERADFEGGAVAVRVYLRPARASERSE
jgi:hypothetical protein